jgi:nitrogen fixation/metabolism regulation signal transduction histidine kinase
MIISKQAQLANFFEAVALNSQQDAGAKNGQKDDAQTQVEIATAQGKQIITLRGTRLPDGGYVAVFDDATAMVQAQRDAAWGEVARRLAHEIKNPLTPIQLSAERMAHKLHDKLADADAKMLIRSTETIVNQVDALKKMVNEFSEYARSPAPHFDRLDLNLLIHEVMSLYDLPKIRIEKNLTTQASIVKGDSTMLRQVLHNLLQNAQDALADKKTPVISVATESVNGLLVLTVQDNGGGFAADMMPHIFEPYMTSKPHGTGLGLAIVKKIIEEHKGNIKIENATDSNGEATGAVVTIGMPLFNDVAESII